MISAREVAARLDQATAKRRLLNHPFYEAWSDGSLTMADLRHYSTQYWRQVEAFPEHLRSIAGALPPSTPRRIVESNLRDEVEGDHAGLWLKFAEALGIASSAVMATPAEAETARSVNAFASATERSPQYALGMLYGYESQTPEVAETKIAGLKNNYGIEGPAVDYFELHGRVDVEHASELAEAIALAADDGSIAEAEAGATAGAEAIWLLLDGVERVRQNSPN
jgi:pyrroloquinoline-quinone synthase